MDLPTIILLLVAISIGATSVAVVVAFRSTREAKSAIFPIIKEEEIIRAKRARVSIVVWATITVLLLGGWLASLRLENRNTTSIPAPIVEIAITTTPIVIESPVAAVNINESEPPLTEIVPTDTPTIPATNTPAPLADTATPTATNTPAPPADTATIPATNTPAPPADTATIPATNTPAPLADTATPLPTDTPPLPTDTPTPELSATEEATVSPPANPAPSEAKMGTVEFATEITDKVEAIDPNTVFTNTVDPIYAVFPYSGMTNGLDFKIIWYLNDEELWRDETKWEWGARYRYYSYFSPYRTGSYKIDVYVNDSILTSGTFEIR